MRTSREPFGPGDEVRAVVLNGAGRQRVGGAMTMTPGGYEPIVNVGSTGSVLTPSAATFAMGQDVRDPCLGGA